MAKKKKSKVKLPKKVQRWLGGIVILLVLQLLATLVPYEKVPPGARPVYNKLLAYRNTLVRRTGLPVNLYPAKAKVVAGDAEVELFFAPSPDIDDALVAFISRAQTSVAICVYDLDLENVVEALVKARERGVMVRFITDTDNAGLAEIRPLLNADIPMMADGRSAIMHNKFVVVDEEWVWTGSYNFTRNGTDKNDNNALTIRSRELAANYLAEFEEMWNDEFGPKSPSSTPYPELEMGNMSLGTYFAPEDRVMRRLLALVESAEVSVDVMAFSFTSEAFAEELETRVAKGIPVRVLFDNRQAKGEHSVDETLDKAGVEVKISGNRRGVMHHKVIIIDGETVVTGSFNFSKNADTANDENILIMRSPEIAAVYAEEFRRCWTGTKGY